MELGGGAAPHSLEVGLHHGVGVREVLVLGDGGQALRAGEMSILISLLHWQEKIDKQRNMSVSLSAEYAMLHDSQ